MIRGYIKGVIRNLRKEPGQRMFWVGREKDCPNFGDIIGPYLFEKITGSPPVFTKTSNVSLRSVHMSVGSILFWCKEDCVVWGSGVIYEGQTFPRPQRTFAVRGPLTRQHFLNQNYDCPEVYGDPGLLMPLYYAPSGVKKKYEIGVIPHYVDKAQCDKYFKNTGNIKIIDVFGSIEKVVHQILQCQMVVSSSLHGVVMAHAYSIPAAWIKFSDDLWGDDIKFHDYYKSIKCSAQVEPYLVENSDITKLRSTVVSSYKPEDSVLSGIREGLLKSCPF